MKRFLFLLMIASTVHSLQAQDKVFVDDKNAEVRKLGAGFNSISVSSSIDLYLSQGNEETVVVSAAEDKYRDRIITEVKDGVLKIYYNDKGFNWMSTNKKLKAYVSFKDINKLTASGSSDVYVNGSIKGDKLELQLHGSSDFKGAVEVDNLTIIQSGSSDSRINGRVHNASIDVSGASDVKGYDLSVDYLQAHATGASDIQITVNKELNANATGSSDIYYKGEGLIREVKSSGSSSVSRRS